MTSKLAVASIIVTVLFFSPRSSAQTDAQIEAIAAVSGAVDAESLDEQEVEKYLDLLSHPLEINLSNRSRLISSGILTQFQVASLIDYRQRNGDALSVSELATIEGFGGGSAEILAPFLSFRSRSLPGQLPSDTLKVSQDLMLRGAAKNGLFNYGIKHKLKAGDRLETSLAAKTAYSDDRLIPPSSTSFNLVFYGSGALGKVIVGDFNSRFGQGLSLWSGFSMSGFSSSSSFFKRPSGLSPSWSYSGTGTHRGVAADFLRGRFVLSSFLSFPGLRKWCEEGKPPEISVLPGANLAWYGKSGQVSVTGYLLSGSMNMPASLQGGKFSVDSRFSFKGIDSFGEAAWDFTSGTLAAVAGVVAPLHFGLKFSALARCYPEDFSSGYAGAAGAWSKTADEYGFVAGLERGAASLTADFARKAADKSVRQCKFLLKVPLQLASKLVFTIRVTERIRQGEVLLYKTGARCDLDFSSAGVSARYGPSDGNSWTARFRAESLLCRSLSGLTYLETGRLSDGFSAFIRCTVFLIDNWDDRIYSYERDAPGSFTVPAYYGRGYSLSAVASRKFRLRKEAFKFLKLYVRASAVRYSFMKDPKPSSAELKAQVVFDL